MASVRTGRCSMWEAGLTSTLQVRCRLRLATQSNTADDFDAEHKTSRSQVESLRILMSCLHLQPSRSHACGQCALLKR